MDFQLHPQLKKDLIPLGELELSQVFLLPDSDHPWLVLVPRVAHIKEFFELGPSQQAQHCEEINKASRTLTQLYTPDKLNIGMLGNMVPQLHTHIICRFQGDRSWPGSIWGSELSKNQNKIAKNIEQIKGHLKLC